MNSLIALAAAALYTSNDVRMDDDEEEETEEFNDDEISDEPVKEAKPAKAAKKGGKKTAKKVEKKGAKKTAPKTDKSDKNVVRLKDLAKQAKLTEAVCRKKLRDAEVPRGEGRWSWELGSKALKAARKALGLAA
jgi:hypothetical protein